MQEDIGSLLRSLIREEIRNMAPQAVSPGPSPGALPGPSPAVVPGPSPGTPPGPSPAMAAAPALMAPGGPPAGTWAPDGPQAGLGQAGHGAESLSPAQILARAHMELTESMRQNLQKLQAVLRETETLAQQMEQFLSYQSRQPWQREDARQAGRRQDQSVPAEGQGDRGGAAPGGTGPDGRQGQPWNTGMPQGWGEQGPSRQGAARTRRLWRGSS